MDYEEFASDIPLDRAIEFRSAEENEEIMLRSGIEQRVRQLGRGPFVAHFAASSTKHADFYCDRFSKAVSMYLEPPKGTVGLAIFRSANGEFLASGHQVANNKLVVLPDGCGVDVVAPDLCGSDDIALSQARLNELSEVLCLTSVQPAKLTVIDGNPERLQLLRKAIVEQVAHPQPDPQGETVCNLVAQMVAWIGDACCPAGKELKNGNPKKARVARLVRDFIEDNYRYPVRLEDLCRETGVSVRTLQRSFREYFNLTITDYLRALRLNEAQRALRRAEPSGNSVTRIALHHGFTHLGRFSVEYRHNFGESPKETLAA